MTEHEPPLAVPSKVLAAPQNRSVLNGLREFFWRGQQLLEARRYVYDARSRGFHDFDHARVALRDARQLSASRAGRDAALLLYRSIVRLLVRATALRQAPSAEDASWSELRANAAELRGWPSGDESSRLDEFVFGERGEAALAALSPDERDRTLAALHGLAARLVAPLQVEASRVSRVRRSRILRIGTALLLVVAPLWWVRPPGLRARPNLALNRPVFVTDNDSRFGVDPRFVVDGDELNLGFHTANHPDMSVTIDLGAVRRVTRVEVYNRADCCQDRATPLSLQLASDNAVFQTFEKRTRRFNRWTVTLPKKTWARYVRLAHEGSEPFHLSEIEVF